MQSDAMFHHTEHKSSRKKNFVPYTNIKLQKHNYS